MLAYGFLTLERLRLQTEQEEQQEQEASRAAIAAPEQRKGAAAMRATKLPGHG